MLVTDILHFRSLLESYSPDIKEGDLGAVKERYKKLWDVLLKKKDYEPVSLLDIEPEDKMECFRWVQSISLSVSVQLYRYSCGNYYGNLNFIRK